MNSSHGNIGMPQSLRLGSPRISKSLDCVSDGVRWSRVYETAAGFFWGAASEAVVKQPLRSGLLMIRRIGQAKSTTVKGLILGQMSTWMCECAAQRSGKNRERGCFATPSLVAILKCITVNAQRHSPSRMDENDVIDSVVIAEIDLVDQRSERFARVNRIE